jgi:hypothetical protein
MFLVLGFGFLGFGFRVLYVEYGYLMRIRQVDPITPSGIALLIIMLQVITVIFTSLYAVLEARPRQHIYNQPRPMPKCIAVGLENLERFGGFEPFRQLPAALISHPAVANIEANQRLVRLQQLSEGGTSSVPHPVPLHRQGVDDRVLPQGAEYRLRAVWEDLGIRN